MVAAVTNLTQAEALDSSAMTSATVGGANGAMPVVTGSNFVGIDGSTFCQQLDNDSTALTANNHYSAWVSFGGSSYDLSAVNQAFCVHFKNNSPAFTSIATNSDSIWLILFSGGGTTNYGRWHIDPTNLLDGLFYPLMMYGTPDATGGTFDNTDVTGFGFAAETSDGSIFGFQMAVDQLIYINGAAVLGDTGVAATVGMIDYFNLLKPDSGETYHSLLVKRAGPTFEFGFPIEIASDDYADSTATVGVAFRESDNKQFPSMPAGYYEILITGQASGSIVLSNASLANNATDYDLTIDGSAASTVITMTSCLMAGVDDVSITGSGVTMVGCTVSSPATCEIADGDLEITINDCTAAINWSADLTAGSTITTNSDIDVGFDVGDYSDININFTANADFAVNPTTSAGTYTFTGLTTTGSVNFDNDSANNTTISIASGLTYTVESPTTGGGTITIAFPPTSTTIQYPNIVDGARYQFYNVTAASEMANSTTSGGTGIDETFTLGTDYSANDTVRLRVTQTSTVTAKEEFLRTFTFGGTSATNSFPDAMVNDVVYNDNAIDGSTVTKFSADYVNDEVDVVVTANWSGAEFYAWWTYNNTTSQGIDEFFGGVTAIDAGNFRINDSVVNIFFDITNTSNVKQTDNIRIFREDEAYPVKDPTTGGGGIDINWRNAVLIAETGVSGLTAAESTQLFALGTPAQNWEHVIEGTYSAEESMRLQNSVLLGKLSGANTDTEVFRDISDTKDRVTATVDTAGNRTAITLDET